MSVYDPLLTIEFFIIAAVVVLQLSITGKVSVKIKKLSRIFDRMLFIKTGYLDREELKNPESVTESTLIMPEDKEVNAMKTGYVRVSLACTESKDEIINRIKNAINTYLLNNYGAAVNFSIIKDMIDREVDALDEEISQSIPTPLYLGLAATMVGIIFGLFAMPAIDGSNFTEGINRLIDGVKLAMTASLIGLMCTTILSSFSYKGAKKKTLLKKNNQLSYLQAKLLPELIRAEDTGVSGLKASLDHFAREATSITDSVHRSAVQTGHNLQVQDSIIARLERLNMTKVSRANLELFGRLENNMEAFQNFSEYLSSMEAIAFNLKEFAARTTHIDRMTGDIHASVSQSRELVRFLTSHFEKIESAGTAALRAVDLSDSHFRESVVALKQRTQTSIDELFSLSNKTESELKETLEKITGTIGEATSRHIDEFVVAYGNAVPQFKQLEQLELLQPIREILASKTDSFINQSEKTNQAIIAHLQELTGKISHWQNNRATEGLETAVRELTRQLTGKEPSSFQGKKRWLSLLETILRLLALTVIITACSSFIYYLFTLIR